MEELSNYKLWLCLFGSLTNLAFMIIIRFNSKNNELPPIKINDLTKRYDVIIYKPNGEIFLLIECKAPEISISQQTFDQIARYNLVLNADYLMVTNGLNHYFCQMDFKNEKYIFLKELPNF